MSDAEEGSAKDSIRPLKQEPLSSEDTNVGKGYSESVVEGGESLESEKWDGGKDSKIVENKKLPEPTERPDSSLLTVSTGELDVVKYEMDEEDSKSTFHTVGKPMEGSSPSERAEGNPPTRDILQQCDFDAAGSERTVPVTFKNNSEGKSRPTEQVEGSVLPRNEIGLSNECDSGILKKIDALNNSESEASSMAVEDHPVENEPELGVFPQFGCNEVKVSANTPQINSDSAELDSSENSSGLLQQDDLSNVGSGEMDVVTAKVGPSLSPEIVGEHKIHSLEYSNEPDSSDCNDVSRLKELDSSEKASRLLQQGDLGTTGSERMDVECAKVGPSLSSGIVNGDKINCLNHSDKPDSLYYNSLVSRENEKKEKEILVESEKSGHNSSCNLNQENLNGTAEADGSAIPVSEASVSAGGSRSVPAEPTALDRRPDGKNGQARPHWCMNYSDDEPSGVDGGGGNREEKEGSNFTERQPNPVLSSSDDSDSSSDDSASTIDLDSSSDDSDGDSEKLFEGRPKVLRIGPKTKGELGLEDLPPIEDLHITVKEEQCTPLGVIYTIVQSLLVIESLPNTPALNLDSVLFKKDGEALGRIFDVFGPVVRPFYSVRFNSREEIDKRELVVGDIIYCAPQTEHTAYVFAYQLMKEKGSDASWKDNNEPPPQYIEYSDDEEEMRAKRDLRMAKASKHQVIDEDAPPIKKMVGNNTLPEGRFNRGTHGNHGGPVQGRRMDLGWHNRRPGQLAGVSGAGQLPPGGNLNQGQCDYRQPQARPQYSHQQPSGFMGHRVRAAQPLRMPPPPQANMPQNGIPQHRMSRQGSIPPPRMPHHRSMLRNDLMLPPPGIPQSGPPHTWAMPPSPSPPPHRFGCPPSFQPPVSPSPPPPHFWQNI